MVHLAPLHHEFTPEEFEPVGQQLDTMRDQYRLAGLNHLYHFGEVVAEGFEAASHRLRLRFEGYDEARYANHVAKIAKVPTEELIACWTAVKHWDRSAFDAICSHPNITARHLVRIAPIEDESYREQMLQRVIRDNLSPEKLEKVIQARRRRQGGMI
ncbi:MAG: hypothetical protein GXY83_00010 [Rhodopirellula sp.]|nr:hypothetical protein [Rhodopirellula sp.]